jgi:hypothetical protein
MTPLLDINTLVALGWQPHEHHARAWRWFQRQEHFATCALTQLGFLRVSTALPYYTATPQDIRAVLESLISRPGHIFLPCNKGIELFEPGSTGFSLEEYLAGLALENDGKLAVLERPAIRRAVLVIPR